MRPFDAVRLSCCAFLGVIGCSDSTAPARDQWKIFLGTDAVVPDFGNQVDVQLLAADGTAMEPPRIIDASRPELWPISFGVVPNSDAPPRIRARLYRLDQTAVDGTPNAATVIEATATLPRPAGVTSVALSLDMACFGVAALLDQSMTCDPSSGQLAAEPTLTRGYDPKNLPTVGSWPPAIPVPCGSDAPDGMICVPGGSFIFGTTQYVPIDAASDPYPPHLVQLSPFALDVDEVTVGEIRSLVNTKGLPPPVMPGTSFMDQQACTYLGPNDSSQDAFPANCLTWAIASQACTLLGKRLPREAEWEYAAGNQGLKTQFSWGSDPAICDHAIVARGLEGDLIDCLGSSTVAGGPVAVGTAADVTMLGIHDMAGSESEWLIDAFEPFSSPCWTDGGPLLVNPTCTATSPANHAERGGAWDLPSYSANVSFRLNNGSDGFSPSVGFRCAVDM